MLCSPLPLWERGWGRGGKLAASVPPSPQPLSHGGRGARQQPVLCTQLAACTQPAGREQARSCKQPVRGTPICVVRLIECFAPISVVQLTAVFPSRRVDRVLFSPRPWRERGRGRGGDLAASLPPLPNPSPSGGEGLNSSQRSARSLRLHPTCRSRASSLLQTAGTRDPDLRRALDRVLCSNLRGSTDCCVPLSSRRPSAFLPSPLEGEGPGERGQACRSVPPSPQPLSHGGRGAQQQPTLCTQPAAAPSLRVANTPIRRRGGLT